MLSPAATADMVTDWNEITLDMIRAHATNPPFATRALAMVHLAIYDAVNGIEGTHEPYLVHDSFHRNASLPAAAAQAAYTVLVDLYPASRPELHEALMASLATIPNDASKARGRAAGSRCGKAMVRHRGDDGSGEYVAYSPSGEFGYWRPTPPGFVPALLPQWPYLKPFAMAHGAQFRVEPPPPFDSPEYAAAYNEVRELGAVDSLARSADQTEIAYYWEDGPGTATPPGHWQVIARQIAAEHGTDLVENARLFALLSMVQADGAIVSWDNKYHYDHVRPYTAITEEADLDENPDTIADPGWFNLIPTPPFPTYTSGHSTFSAGSSRLVALFFGADDIPFSAASPDPQRWPDHLNGVVRSFDTLSEAAEEAGQSRIYGGIHWQYDNQGGLNSGRALADYVFGTYLRPLGDDPHPGDGDDDDDDDDDRGRPGRGRGRPGPR